MPGLGAGQIRSVQMAPPVGSYTAGSAAQLSRPATVLSAPVTSMAAPRVITAGAYSTG